MCIRDRSGTDVTKEASDLILLDDDFTTLVNAVAEGRSIYHNIRKFIRYLLSCNIGEVLTMFLGMLFSMPVVLLPIQILDVYKRQVFTVTARSAS